MATLLIPTDIVPSEFKPLEYEQARVTAVFNGVIDEDGDLKLETARYIDSILLKYATSIKASVPVPNASGSVVRMDGMLLMKTDDGFWANGVGNRYYLTDMSSSNLIVVFDAGKQDD